MKGPVTPRRGKAVQIVSFRTDSPDIPAGNYLQVFIESGPKRDLWRQVLVPLSEVMKIVDRGYEVE